MYIHCFKATSFLFHPKKVVGTLIALLLAPALMFAADRSGLRGERYCEIVISKTLTHFAVYNTLGLNNCPEDKWNKVTTREVKKETGASFVYLNGPRYWVIDGFLNSKLVNPTIKTLNGIAMREAGVLSIKMSDLFKANAPYYRHPVQRHTTWIYEPGKPIYELVGADGTVYVMQSFSTKKEPQTERTLTALGSKLKLPKNWVFKTGVLHHQESVEAVNNLAIVVQDNFDNTYQQATHDLLK